MGTKVFSTYTHIFRAHSPCAISSKTSTKQNKTLSFVWPRNNVNNQSYFYKQHPFSCAKKKLGSQKWKFYVIKSDKLPRYVLKRLIHLETYFFGSNPKYSTANFELLLPWNFKLWFTRSQVLCQDKEINKLCPIK